MRIKIRFLLFAIVFGCISLSAQHDESKVLAPTTQFAVITIKGMVCQEGCADAIAVNLNKLPGVDSADVSFELGEAIINFNQELVSIDSLKSVITNTKVKDYSYIIEKVTIVEPEQKSQKDQ